MHRRPNFVPLWMRGQGGRVLRSRQITNIDFTDAELAALQDWFPRVSIANVVRKGTSEHTAIEKIAPGSLPSSWRHEIIAASAGCVGSPAAKLIKQVLLNDRLICALPDDRCEFCNKQAELRPYGPNGERICFQCGMKDEAACKRGFDKRFGCSP
jgi:hypothetical protein